MDQETEKPRRRWRRRALLLLLAALLARAIAGAGAHGGFEPDDADSVAALARARARVLILHGTADTNVLPDHARALADASGASLEWIDGATHYSVFGEAAFARVLDFIQR